MMEPVAEMFKELDVEELTLTLEQECISAGRMHKRIFNSARYCTGCRSDKPKRYSVNGKCLKCIHAGRKPSTDTLSAAFLKNDDESGCFRVNLLLDILAREYRLKIKS